MNDFAWIKLLLRAVGVLLIGLGVPHALAMTGSIANGYINARGLHVWEWLPGYAASLEGYLAQVGFGFYLLVNGRAITRLCMSDLRNVCLQCGYDIASIPGGTCPECGTPIRREVAGADPKRSDAAQ